MKFKEFLKKYLPEPLKTILRPIRNKFVNKYSAELSFWESRYEIDNGVFGNSFYKKLMLGIVTLP